jgi:MFS family permease
MARTDPATLPKQRGRGSVPSGSRRGGIKKMNRRRAWIFVFLFTLTMINYADRVALSVAAKPIATEFGLSPVQMGYLLSSFLWMYLLCLLPVGLLVDRFGGKIVNAAGIGLWSAATVLTGFSVGFSSMATTRVIMGIGESTSWPASNRVIREWFPATERGLANAIFGAGAAAGPALGSVLVSAVVVWLGWRAGFFAAGGIGFIWLTAWLAVFDKPERVRWLSPTERDKILNERDGVTERPAEQAASSLRYLLSLRSVWGLFLTQGCEVYGGYMLLTWLPSYLQSAKGLSVLNAGMLTAVPFGTAMVMVIVFGWVSDRLLTHDAVNTGRRRIMLAVLMLCTSLLLLVPFIDNLWGIVVILAIARSTGAAGSALNFALVTDLVRNRADIGKVTSITVIGGNSFGLMGPIVTGYVLSITGSFDGTFAVAGVLALVGAAITLTMTHKPIEGRPGAGEGVGGRMRVLRKLWWGQYPLVQAFWVFYVAGFLGCVVFASITYAVFYAIHARPFGVLAWAFVFTCYLLIASVGVWRSADAYPCTRWWPIWAKIVVGLFAARVFWSLANGGARSLVDRIMS